MERFEKIIGKKTDQPTPEERPAQPPAPSQTSAPASTASSAQTDPGATAPDGSFGLKFVFDSGETRMFTSLPITIGRAEGNMLVIRDETISANHAVILYDERVREICLVDLESLNGTTVDDQPTLKNVLSDGARIGLGRVRLVYRDTGYIHPS